MPDQYLAFYEETIRGVTPGSPSRKFLEILDGIEPKYAPKDDSVKAYRGVDTGLGDGSVRRLEHQYSHGPKFRLFPGDEVGILLKHLLGYCSAPATVDTTAKKRLLYPILMPYGSGAPLADSAIAMEPNLERGGVTKSQKWAGERFKSATIEIKPGSDITVAMEGQGPGDYVGSPNQSATAGVAFPTTTPYNYYDAKCYIGAGATLTGTAPDYTDIAPNTMTQFQPDDLTIKITNGLDDKPVLNSVKGPSKTERTAQFSVEIDFTIDFRDPSVGFAALTKFESLFTAPNTDAMMIVLDNGLLAGAATEHFKETLFVPFAQITAEMPARNNDGKQSKVKFKAKSLLSATYVKPFFWQRSDQDATY
jgi:hypothetical protein